MKLVVRIVFWLALSFLSFCALGLLFSNLTVLFIPVMALVGILVIRQLFLLHRRKQAGDTAGAKKIRRHLALVLLSPVVLDGIILLWMFIGLSRMIG